MRTPLLIADVSRLLPEDDGWNHRRDGNLHIWDRDDSLAAVSLPYGESEWITVCEPSGWLWKVPPKITPDGFATVLATAGLLPGGAR